MSTIRHTIPKVIELAQRYKDITKRDCEVTLLFAVPTKDTIEERVLEQARDRIREDSISCRVIVVAYDDLGIEVTPDAA